MLLSVIALIAQGIIKTNFIEFTPDRGELFTLYRARLELIEKRLEEQKRLGLGRSTMDAEGIAGILVDGISQSK